MELGKEGETTDFEGLAWVGSPTGWGRRKKAFC